MDPIPSVFAIDISRSNLCFKLCLLERGFQVTTYDFGFMDNPTTNQFDRSLYKIRATPPYKDTEGVEFASNFVQIEIRNVCRLFLFMVRK
jgi:hypothetical protein